MQINVQLKEYFLSISTSKKTIETGINRENLK
jgi:hypothetical protein